MIKFRSGFLMSYPIPKSSLEKMVTVISFFLFGFVCVMLLSWILLNIPVPGIQETSSWAYSAFRHEIYYPVRAFIEGFNPYDGPDYLSRYPVHDHFRPFLPMILLIHLPLGFLPLRAAAMVFFSINIGLCVIMVYLALRIAGSRTTLATVLFLTTLLLISRPGLSNALLGIGTALVGVGTYIALYWKDNHPLLAAFGFCLTCFKPQFGLPLGVLLIFSRNFRIALIGGLIALLLSLGPMLVLSNRVSENQSITNLLIDSYRLSESYLDSSPLRGVNRIDTKALASRIIGVNLPPLSEALIGISIIVLAGGLCYRLGTSLPERKLQAEISIVAILCCVFHQRYDLMLLLAPLINVIKNGHEPHWRNHPYLRLISIFLMFLLGLNYISTSTALHHMGLSSTSMAWVIFSSINSLVLVLLLLIYAAVAFSASTRPDEESVILA